MNRVLVLLFSVLLALPAFAQNKKQEEKSFKERIEATKVAYFTEKIGLTPEEAQRFWPVYYKFWNEKQDAYKKVRKSIESIIKLDEKGDYSDPEMKKLINQYGDYLSLEGEIFEMYIDEFYKILPTNKVAKIFTAEVGFRKILTDMWKEQKKPKHDDKGAPKKPEDRR